MRDNMAFLWFFCVLFVFGCSTAQHNVGNNLSSTPPRQETSQEAISAMKSVTSSISGEKISDEDLKSLDKELKKDEEAQSAVRTITDALSEKRVIIKYCPVTGKRYSPSLKKCPIHGVELIVVEE